MLNINYDILSYILDYLTEKECYNLAISSKAFNSVLRNQGFQKCVTINTRYPSESIEDAFVIMKRIVMHRRRMETLNVHCINDPVPWIPYWSKTVKFVMCSFDKNTIDPKKKVTTEYLHIRTKLNKNDIKINYENFPNLKKILIE